MKTSLVVMVVSTLVVGAGGCRSGNWFGRPAAAPVMPAVTYGSPAPPGVVYVDPAGTPPVAAPSGCGPGCTSCGSTPPTLSGAQGYLPVPGN
jgi:hypothetical protein